MNKNNNHDDRDDDTNKDNNNDDNNSLKWECMDLTYSEDVSRWYTAVDPITVRTSGLGVKLLNCNTLIAHLQQNEARPWPSIWANQST